MLLTLVGIAEHGFLTQASVFVSSSSETVYQALQSLQRTSPSDFMNEAKKTLVGKMVLTMFNYATYRIDEIVSLLLCSGETAELK